MAQLTSTLKERLYLGPIRRVARRAGLGHIRGVPAFVGSQMARIRYGLLHPETVSVRLGNFSARFPVASAAEMFRIERLNGEKKLISRLLKEILPGDVVYDIGANIGLYTVFLAQAAGQSGQVIGFEPELRCYRQCTELLRSNYILNACVFNMALGQSEAEGELVLCGEAASGAHHLTSAGMAESGTLRQPTRIVCGDHFVVERNLPPPNILKIDVEGTEAEVLAGLASLLARPECRLVCCEVHFALLARRGQSDAPNRIVAFLRQAGFTDIEWIGWSHCLARKK